MDTYGKIEQLIRNRNISAYRLSKDTGISTGLLSQWKKRLQNPSAEKLQIIADYFNVSIDYLLGNDQKETPTLNEKDERDIKVKIDEIINMMSNQQGLMFDGNPLTPEALESIRNAMELGMAAAKLKNKQKHNK